MGKKGLSTVVTTMIIIALSLAAIAMVWVVVNNLISNSSEKIDLGRTTVGLEITSLKIKDFSMDVDRKSTRLNSSHIPLSRMPSSA